MFEPLKSYCKTFVPLNENELQLIDNYFQVKKLKKREFILESGTVCDFIAFIESGTIRHFHVKDGLEKTCDISFENSWVTDFYSFNNSTPCIINLQAMEDTILYSIKREDLYQIYKTSHRYETFGRLMAEQVAQRATNVAMSLSADKPEERFRKLLENEPDLFQKVPQKYIANFLGITPESLSRIKKRRLQKQKSQLKSSCFPVGVYIFAYKNF